MFVPFPNACSNRTFVHALLSSDVAHFNKLWSKILSSVADTLSLATSHSQPDPWALCKSEGQLHHTEGPLSQSQEGQKP